MTSRCFVFGSNFDGRHGKGAALYAKLNYGAVYGVGVGRTGNAYAIPTKDGRLRTLPLTVIKQYVDGFVEYAKANPDLEFNVTRVGCGLANLCDSAVAPLFSSASENCFFDEFWRTYLGDSKNYWGTYA